MKRLRHRLGRWLLRDAKPQLRLVTSDPGAAREIQRMLLRLKRERGTDLGLS